MKKTQMPYTDAEISIILLTSEDIVTASGDILSNDSEPTYDDGGWT